MSASLQGRRRLPVVGTVPTLGAAIGTAVATGIAVAVAAWLAWQAWVPPPPLRGGGDDGTALFDRSDLEVERLSIAASREEAEEPPRIDPPLGGEGAPGGGGDAIGAALEAPRAVLLGRITEVGRGGVIDGLRGSLELVDAAGTRHRGLVAADGTFRFEAEPGAALLLAEVGGEHAARLVTLRRHPESRVTLAFGAPQAWQIEVSDGNGPIAGASVELDGVAGRTDAHGVAQLATSAAGAPFLLVRAPGRATLGAMIAVPPTDGPDGSRRHAVRLAPAASVTIEAPVAMRWQLVPSRLAAARYPWPLLHETLAGGSARHELADLPEATVSWSARPIAAAATQASAPARAGRVELHGGECSCITFD